MDEYRRFQDATFPAKLTAKTGTTPILYSWTEQAIGAAGVLVDANPPRTGSPADGYAVELNNANVDISSGTVCVEMRQRGVAPDGFLRYEFQFNSSASPAVPKLARITSSTTLSNGNYPAVFTHWSQFSVSFVDETVPIEVVPTTGKLISSQIVEVLPTGQTGDTGNAVWATAYALADFNQAGLIARGLYPAGSTVPADEVQTLGTGSKRARIRSANTVAEASVTMVVTTAGVSEDSALTAYTTYSLGLWLRGGTAADDFVGVLARGYKSSTSQPGLSIYTYGTQASVAKTGVECWLDWTTSSIWALTRNLSTGALGYASFTAGSYWWTDGASRNQGLSGALPGGGTAEGGIITGLPTPNGIDATVGYVKSAGGNGTLTFVKGVLTASA